jgi:uncharacterized iron-regulated protein
MNNFYKRKKNVILGNIFLIILINNWIYKMKKVILGIVLMITYIYSVNASENVLIYDNTGKKVSIDEMVKNTENFDVIFFGEFHDDSLNHCLQHEYLKKIYDLDKNVTVSLEMFERDVQSSLNDYLSGKITEEEFLKVSRPWPDYNKFYKQIVEIAKDNNSAVIAANIPRKYAAMYVQGGMTSYKDLSENEKNYIAKTLVLTEDKYLDKFLETMIGSKEAGLNLEPNKLNTLYLYYGAQCIKDETMAESILQHFNENPDNKIIHFNGDFHSNSYLGTAAMLKRRNDKIKIAVITPIYYDNIEEISFNDEIAVQGNYMIFLPRPKREEMGQMMGGPSHFGENFATEHNINIEIDPKNSFIKGNDRIIFKNPILKASSLKLLKSLEITSMSSKDKNLKFSIEPVDDYYNQILIENISLQNQTYTNGGIKESFEAYIEYEGKVYNTPSETNMIKRHSNTPGIISGKDDEGIYLPGAAYYPQADKDMAKFNIYVTLPNEYKIVATGDITTNMGTKNVIYQIKSDKNVDEVTLVAAKFKSIEREHDGIKFAVYYYKDAPHNEKYLDESIKYYDIYTKLFGKYPYNSFSIAENFFATGFGMPGYTLLSNKLMAMPWVTLSPGSLAHEFVHNWWGNSVFVENSTGNWCEALTTFSTNYYYSIINNNTKEALDWRRKALLAIDALPEDKNYPVSEFKYQSNTYDAVIGYSKGAFIFQEILKIVGTERFFNTLKLFSEKFSGKRAYWMNLTGEFVNNTKDTLKDIKMRNVINDWIKSKEIPTIKFAENPVINNDSAIVTISNSIKRVLSVPITINYSEISASEKHYLMLKDTVNKFTISVKSGVKSIELDSELETLRKLNSWEKPFSFNRTLSSKPIVVLPEKTSPDFLIAMKYVEIMKESGFDFEYNTLENLNSDDLKFSSLILLGSIKSNKLISEYSKQFPDGLNLNINGFKYEDKFTDFKNDILMASIEHLFDPDKNCTIIYYDSLTDVAPLNRLIHYQSYSLVLLNSQRTGRPVYNCEIFPNGGNISIMKWENK